MKQTYKFKRFYLEKFKKSFDNEINESCLDSNQDGFKGLHCLFGTCHHNSKHV